MNKNTILLLMKLARQKIKEQIDTNNPNIEDSKMVFNFIDRSLTLLEILGNDDIIVIDDEEIDEIEKDDDIDRVLNKTFSKKLNDTLCPTCGKISGPRCPIKCDEYH